jgi:hypothetical protein
LAIQRGRRKRPSEAVERGEAILDCGGKRSATPLSDQTGSLGRPRKALSPLRSASAVHDITATGVRMGLAVGGRLQRLPAAEGVFSRHKWTRRGIGYVPDPAIGYSFVVFAYSFATFEYSFVAPDISDGHSNLRLWLLNIQLPHSDIRQRHLNIRLSQLNMPKPIMNWQK